jgi:hypothetical protein
VKKFYVINRKIVAIIGFIIAAIWVFPERGVFKFEDFWFAVLWFIGGLFTWKKKVWAAILLAVLAVYDLLSLIRDFLTLRSYAQNLTADFHLAESTIFTVFIAVYSIGTGMYLYVLFYGICMVIAKWNKQDLEM